MKLHRIDVVRMRKSLTPLRKWAIKTNFVTTFNGLMVDGRRRDVGSTIFSFFFRSAAFAITKNLYFYFIWNQNQNGKMGSQKVHVLRLQTKHFKIFLRCFFVTSLGHSDWPNSVVGSLEELNYQTCRRTCEHDEAALFVHVYYTQLVCFGQFIMKCEIDLDSRSSGGACNIFTNVFQFAIKWHRCRLIIFWRATRVTPDDRNDRKTTRIK